MAKKKDLTSAINRGTDLFFSANDAQEVQHTHDAQEAQQPRRAQEASEAELKAVIEQMQQSIEAQEARRTQGRKGLKMPRMNMSFTPSNMDYLRVMAGISGMTVTRFMNSIIEQHAEANAERYQRAREVMDE